MPQLGPLLLPNIGAEENLDWRLLLAQPVYHRLAGIWSLLFPTTATSKGLSHSDLLRYRGSARFPTSAISGLPTDSIGIPWLATVAARESLARSEVDAWGPSPEVVCRVHDKAFARRAVSTWGIEPLGIQNLFRVFDPEELDSPQRFLSDLRHTLASWPAWAQARWTLKPRFGSSGRGRVPGSGLEVSTQEIRGSLPRLRQRGGAIAEPILDRVEDLSTQYLVHGPGRISFLGSLRQRMSVSGSYQGHVARLLAGDLSSGSEFEEGLRDSSLKLVSLAASEGFTGPCGVDAFTFRLHGTVFLRSCVELNARFSVGTVVVGLVRRALEDNKRPDWMDGGPVWLDFTLDPAATAHRASPNAPHQLTWQFHAASDAPWTGLRFRLE